MTPETIDALAAVWTVLSRLTAGPPSDETVANVTSPALLADWPLERTSVAASGLALLEAAASEAPEAIREDQYRLMVGPGRVPAVPYESVHRSTEGLLFEAETMAVREAYAAEGLQAPRLNREPDDHVSLELEFLAQLLTQALDALEAGDPERVEAKTAAHDRFLGEHLAAWGPAFFGLVAGHAATSFYRGVGLLGQDAIAQAQG